MAVKKKRTAKQIAATKKLVALNKRRRAAASKKTVKKKRKAVKKKKAVSRASRVAKKRTVTRIKRRKNPVERFVAQISQKNHPSNVGYLTSAGMFDSEVKFAKKFTKKAEAEFVVKVAKENPDMKGWNISVKKY